MEGKKEKRKHNEKGRDTFCETRHGREKKKAIVPLEDFDPRPPQFQGTAHQRLPELLEKIRGEQLCVSLIFDEHYRHSDDNSATSPTKPVLPYVSKLRKSVSAFKESLKMSDEDIRKVEQNTREQRHSTL